jgi:hypothetical protein
VNNTNQEWTQKAYPSRFRKGKSQANIETLVNADGQCVVRVYNEIGQTIFQHSLFTTVELAQTYVDGLIDGLVGIGKWRPC